MDKFDTALKARPDAMSEEEWRLRLELAACYRVFNHIGWTELIFNHITVRVPGPEKHYLINPFGLHYSEVTATSLIKIGLDGEPLHATPYSVNRAGFVIHSAIHAARADAHCIMHVHTTAGMAVACKEAGLSHDDFYGAQFLGRVAYHDFEGITTRSEEQARLVASLGNKPALILRNHGLLVADRDLPTAFLRLWALQRACEVQCAAAAIAGANRVLSAAVRATTARDIDAFDEAGMSALGAKVFDALLRKVDRKHAALPGWINYRQ